MELKTYADWNKAINALKNRLDDEKVLQMMQHGTIQWQTGVAERFTQSFLGAINSRIDYATDRFQKEMKRSRGEERLILNALFLMRKEFRFLKEVCSIPAIREQDRDSFINIVQSAADGVQNSLEESAKKSDRSGKLKHLILTNKVNNI